MLLFILILILIITIIFILVGKFFKIQQDMVRSISLLSSILCFFISLLFFILFDRSSNQYQFVLNDVYTSSMYFDFFKEEFGDIIFFSGGIYEFYNFSFKCSLNHFDLMHEYSYVYLGSLLDVHDFYTLCVESFSNWGLSHEYFGMERLLDMPFYTYQFIISFGIDGISLFFILLSTFITPLCLLTSYKRGLIYVKEYCLILLFLELFIIFSFIAVDLIFFFFFFESILIPMFFLISIWGSRERKIKASFFFFLYTLFGSIFLFFSIIILYYDVGTTNFCIISKCHIMTNKELFLWFFMYLAFSIKIPTLPMHVWLPEAHVEAPTAGSVILAGLLLKLGGYGFIRILLTIFSKSTFFFLPLTDTFAIISIIYASLTTIRQIDMKRIIAYSSVAHMNLVVLGIFSGNIQGISGSIFLMLAHGIVSSALFFLIGVVYDKYGTRIIYYYGGLVQTMPIFTFNLVFFCMGNVGLPGTCNFIGELIVFVGIVDRNFIILLISTVGVILSVLYTIFYCNRIIFGNLNTNYIFLYKDMNLRELCIVTPLLFLTVLLGLYPDVIFDTILVNVSINVEQQHFI